MFCRYCGKENKNTAYYCSECGRELTRPSTGYEQSYAYSPAQSAMAYDQNAYGSFQQTYQYPAYEAVQYDQYYDAAQYNQYYDTAQQYYVNDLQEEYNRVMKRKKIGLLLSFIFSFWSIVFICMTVMVISVVAGKPATIDYGDMIMGMFIISAVGSFVAMIIGGGAGGALRIVGRIAFWGWFIVPPPIDIFTGMFSSLVAILGISMFPFVFVLVDMARTKRAYFG